MATFLLEIGTEELPAGFVPGAIQQLEAFARKDLLSANLPFGAIQVYGTPRRLALMIADLPEQQPDIEQEIKGPPARLAFDSAGKLTPQGEGFARKSGVAPEDLLVKETEKGPLVFARQQISGKPTTELLAELVPQWITRIEGPRLMRWADGDLRFSRPIRSLICLLDEMLIPVTVAGVQTDRISTGHRVLHPESVTITRASYYVEALRSAFVLVDPKERSQRIAQGIQQVAATAQGEAEVPKDLLEEVIYLVEWPTAILGHFEPEFLELPPGVIKTEMISHQRYFPVHKLGEPETLLPVFIAISNGDPRFSELISKGNGRVIRARLADGRFFFEEDRKQALADFLPKLKKVTFAENLGTVADRVDRITAISRWLASHLGLDASETQLVARTAQLCKADLTTQMVYEFPELQGLTGADYARRDGEDPSVVTGIAEHYQPRNSEDAFPKSLTGRIVGTADRLDLLVGIFGVGLLPSGSSDPFALRRAALAIVEVAWEAGFALNLPEALNNILDVYETKNLLKQPRTQVFHQVIDWFVQRMSGLLIEEKHFDYDVVQAVLGKDDPIYTQFSLGNLSTLKLRLETLQKARHSGILEKIYETTVRVARIISKAETDLHLDLRSEQVIDTSLLTEPAELALYTALAPFLNTVTEATSQSDYAKILTAVEPLVAPVSQFFVEVMVNVPQPEIQQNRLKLLALLRNAMRQFFDVRNIVISGNS
jgi:glycyl-tRNA synthetase beta chain